jgi:hypothetical protein
MGFSVASGFVCRFRIRYFRSPLPFARLFFGSPVLPETNSFGEAREGSLRVEWHGLLLN